MNRMECINTKDRQGRIYLRAQGHLNRRRMRIYKYDKMTNKHDNSNTATSNDYAHSSNKSD